MVGGANSLANPPKDERTDGRLDGQLGGRTVGRTNSWADGQLGGQLGGRIEAVRVLYRLRRAADPSGNVFDLGEYSGLKIIE